MTDNKQDIKIKSLKQIIEKKFDNDDKRNPPLYLFIFIGINYFKYPYFLCAFASLV